MGKNYTSSINVVLEMFMTHFKTCVILAMGLGVPGIWWVIDHDLNDVNHK
jgi:hypothetical protein